MLVGHLPYVVALEAEVLDAQARRARSDHARAPGAVVLDSTGARFRIVQVDPIVRKRLFLSRHERYKDEIAVSQRLCGVQHLGGRRGVETLDQISQREARDDTVDLMIVEVAVTANGYAGYATISVCDRDAAVLQLDANASFLYALGECLPHLPRAEPWVLELFDQRRDVFTPQPQHREHRLAE